MLHDLKSVKTAIGGAGNLQLGATCRSHFTSGSLEGMYRQRRIQVHLPESIHGQTHTHHGD
ncbi:hypothetical protein BGW80DRAFT_1391267, partial [Lactifluus volemus]